MSLQVRYNSATEVADVVTVRQGASFSMAAEEGAVAQSQIVVDDTTNALNYKGHRRLYAYETACQAHNQMVFNGYLGERTIGRQPAEGMDQDEEVFGRRWNLTVADTNSLLSRRLITGPDGDRPEETDIERIQWLLDSNDAYLSNPHDTWENPSPYIETDGPVTMSATDTRGSTAFDVLNDCAQRSGKNWFAFYYEVNDSVPPTNNGSVALWYDFDTSSAYSSTLRLTNVYADIDNTTTFAVFPDALLSIDPARAYSGVYVTFDGPGSPIYVQSTIVENLFQRRDAAVNNQFVKTVAEATALANRYLTDASTEDSRLTCRFVVAKQYVNDLREGQRFQAKLTHLPGLSAYAWCRCLRRTVTQLNDEQYEIAIEASVLPEPAVLFYMLGTHGSGFYTPTGGPVYFPDGSEVVIWQHDGDHPPFGWIAEPAYGPVEGIDEPVSTWPWRGIRVLEYAVVRIDMRGGFGGVANTGATVTVAVRQNGAVIHTETQYWGGGLGTWQGNFDYQLSGIVAQAGDEFEVSYANTGWAGFQYFAKTGGEQAPESHFRVTAP